VVAVRQTAHAYLSPVTNKADALVVQLEPIATTRYEKLIALCVHLAAIRYTALVPRLDAIAEPDPASREIVANASPVFWLPPPDRISVEEAIDWILQERYGIAQEARFPVWATGYKLPAQRPITEEIAELEEQRQEIEGQLSEARGRAAEAVRPRLLLYEKGKDVLEPVVRNTLRQLGARVEDPEKEGVEDGRLFREEGCAVLEIKGRIGQIKQADVRQVVQWASEAKAVEGAEYKPLILGNPQCDTPPGERAAPLAPNALTYARNGGVALVTTMQLFEALRQKQLGSFDEGSGRNAQDARRPDQNPRAPDRHRGVRARRRSDLPLAV
jgi:hypothetical protein